MTDPAHTPTTLPPLIPAEGRLTNFDALRFGLAALVVFCHCYPVLYGAVDTVEPLCVASRRQMSWGTFAVNWFFVISGFLITQSWLGSRGLGDYLKKRVLRIYPGFAVAALVCALVLAPLGTADRWNPWGYWGGFYKQLDLPGLAASTLLLREPRVPWTFLDVPSARMLNASMWTILYEWQCYLLVPLLALLGVFRRRALALVMFAAMFALQAAQFYVPVDLNDWKELPFLGLVDIMPRFVTFFLAGMCVYLYREHIPRSRALLVVSVALLAWSTVGFKGLVLTQPLFGTYVLFYVAYSSRIRLQRWGRWGDFSYGVYLYAWPVQQLLVQRLGKGLGVWGLFVCALAISCVLAALSWHLIEKPCLKLKKRGLSRAPVPGTALPLAGVKAGDAFR